jgi:hypothetical protein
MILKKKLQHCVESGEKYYPIFDGDEYAEYEFGRFYTDERSELVIIDYLTKSEVVSERKRGMAYIWNIGVKGYIRYSDDFNSFF